MSKTEIGKQDAVVWVDVIDPDMSELEKLATEFKINWAFLQSCLDPEHLPKYEMYEGGEFYVLRCYDESCQRDADTTQELTRKIAVFKSKNYLLTIHRRPLKTVELVRERWQSKALTEHDVLTIVYELFRGTLKSFDRPIDTCLDELEAFEMSIFAAEGAKPYNVKEGYLLKRKSFVFRRLIRATLGLLQDIEFPKKLKNHLQEECESSLYYCDELIESTTSLLNLQVSLASQKTNEVVRVLTVFSMFLLPLNVITGIYGMNFEIMPELKWEHGYTFALSLMLAIMAAIYFWFHHKGWLKRP